MLVEFRARVVKAEVFDDPGAEIGERGGGPIRVGSWPYDPNPS